MDSGTGLDDVTALDPRQAVRHLVRPAVLPLGTSVARVPGKSAQAGPAERRQARNGNVLISFETGQAGLLIERRALPLEIGIGTILPIQKADAHFVDHVGTQIAG